MDNRDLAIADRRARKAWSKRNDAAKPVRTVDITPTWKGILPLLMVALENGTHEGKSAARTELQRMAEAADKWNANCAVEAQDL